MQVLKYLMSQKQRLASLQDNLRKWVTFQLEVEELQIHSLEGSSTKTGWVLEEEVLLNCCCHCWILVLRCQNNLESGSNRHIWGKWHCWRDTKKCTVLRPWRGGLSIWDTYFTTWDQLGLVTASENRILILVLNLLNPVFCFPFCYLWPYAHGCVPLIIPWNMVNWAMSCPNLWLTPGQIETSSSININISIYHS